MKNYGHKLGVITAMALAAALPERKLTKEFLESEIDKVEYNRFGETNTHCTITTKSGFTFTGESACVDPNNYNKELGEKYAYENAFEKMWMPYGFWLNKALAEFDQRMNDDGEPKETAVQTTWQDRVCEEIGELVDRKEKLEKCLSVDKPKFVSDAQWDLMKEQLQAMYSYHNILIERLNEDAGVVSSIRLAEKSKSEGLLVVSTVTPPVDSQEHHQQPNMDFGYAVKMMKEGKRVERAGWNGKGMWLGLVNTGYYDVGCSVVNDIDSLLPWIGMKTADNKFVPWLASQTDVLAEDWQIVDWG